jgi:hypothetical protein
MKKLIVNSILILSIFISSCGGGKEENAESNKIDTKDVKGTIESGDAKVGKTTLHNNDGEFDVPSLKMPGGGFLIVPTTRSFAEEWQLVETNLNGFGTFEMIEKTDNSAFFKVIKDFAGKKTEGYNFIVWVKGDKSNFIIKGEGDNMLDPIEKKEDAENMLKVALTFKPE